jgi:3-methyladenine DNA glycosylase AlkD
MRASTRALAAELRSALEAAGDPQRAAQQQAYMKSEMPFAGVATPGLRKISREVFSAHPQPSPAHWTDAILGLWRGAKYREERHAAIGLARAKPYQAFRTPAACPMFEEMIVTGAWWDYVDEISINLIGGLLRDHTEFTRAVLMGWTRDADLWRRRSAIIAQLKFKADTDLELLLAAIEPAMESKEFFLRKAIGWALREHSKTDPAFVVDFVTRNAAALSGLSKREAFKVMLKRGQVDSVP